jgi:hypothetical protein
VAQIPPPSSIAEGNTSEKAERPKLTMQNKKHGHIIRIPCAGTDVTKDSFNRLAGSFDREPNVGTRERRTL